MERRIFIAILLAALVMYGWQVLFPPPAPPERAATQQIQPAPAAPTTPAAPAAAPAPVAAVTVPDAITSEAAEREIVVDTATVQAVLTNRGGRLLHWRLKDYRDGAGEPVDLVPSSLPADQPKPFSLQVDDPQLTHRLNDAIYRVTGDINGHVDAAQNGGTITFEFQDASGLHARKEFRFDPRNFVVVFSATVMNGAQALNPGISWGPGLSDAGATSGGGSFFTGNYVQPPQAIYHRAGDVERLDLADVTEQPVHEGQFRFAGVDDHYFIATVVNPGQARIEYHPLTLPGGDATQRVLLSQTLRLPQPPQDVRFFAGPKRFDLLQAVDGELVRTIN